MGIPNRATNVEGRVWSFRFEARTASKATITLLFRLELVTAEMIWVCLMFDVLHSSSYE